jgi:hypothetical protein
VGRGGALPARPVDLTLQQRFPTGVPRYFVIKLYFNCIIDRLCGLVVSVADYKLRGPGFDSRALLRIFLREFLERGHSAS